MIFRRERRRCGLRQRALEGARGKGGGGAAVGSQERTEKEVSPSRLRVPMTVDLPLVSMDTTAAPCFGFGPRATCGAGRRGHKAAQGGARESKQGRNCLARYRASSSTMRRCARREETQARHVARLGDAGHDVGLILLLDSHLLVGLDNDAPELVLPEGGGSGREAKRGGEISAA